MGVMACVRDGARIDARTFAPLMGVVEDCAALAAFPGRLDRRSQSFVIAQDVDVGRPSRIEAEVDVEDGNPVAVRIGGAAVEVMEGRLLI